MWRQLGGQTIKINNLHEQVLILSIGAVASFIAPFFWLTFDKRDVNDFLVRIAVTFILSIVGSGAFIFALISVRNYLKSSVYPWSTRFTLTGVCTAMTFVSIFMLKESVLEVVSPEFVIIYILTFFIYWVLSLIVMYGTKSCDRKM